MVLEKTLESLLDSKEIKTVNPEGSQTLIFIGRITTEAEAPILWPSDGKNWLTGKDPYAGKDWRGEGGDREWDGWMASLTKWTWVWANSGANEGQGSLACFSLWDCKESDRTWWLNNNGWKRITHKYIFSSVITINILVYSFHFFSHRYQACVFVCV